MGKLSAEQVADQLIELPNWKFEDNKLIKVLKQRNFQDSMILAIAIADLAEKANHHPDLLIQYSRVTIMLTTHDSDGVTDKDIFLAHQIDKIDQKEAVPS